MANAVSNCWILQNKQVDEPLGVLFTPQRANKSFIIEMGWIVSLHYNHHVLHKKEMLSDRSLNDVTLGPSVINVASGVSYGR